MSILTPFSHTSPARRFLPVAALTAVALLSAAPRAAQAALLNFNVSFSDVSSLGSNYSLDAQLFDASGNPANLNSTRLTFQDFTGQSGAIAPFTLSDIQSFNETTTAFSAGSNTSPSPFSFNLVADFTPNAATPDQLNFSFFSNVDPSGNSDALNVFSINFNSGDPNQVQVFTASNGNPNVPAPTIRVSAVPEPSTWVMMALGVGALGLVGRKRKRYQEGVI